MGDGQGVSSACSESHYRFWQQFSRCFVCTYECSAMWQSVFKTQGKLCEFLKFQFFEWPLQTKQYLGRACLLLSGRASCVFRMFRNSSANFGASHAYANALPCGNGCFTRGKKKKKKKKKTSRLSPPLKKKKKKKK